MLKLGLCVLLGAITFLVVSSDAQIQFMGHGLYYNPMNPSSTPMGTVTYYYTMGPSDGNNMTFSFILSDGSNVTCVVTEVTVGGAVVNCTVELYELDASGEDQGLSLLQLILHRNRNLLSIADDTETYTSIMSSFGPTTQFTNLTSTSGSITSVGFPSVRYCANLNSFFLIYGEPGYIVEFVMDYIKVHKSPGCTLDHLDLYDPTVSTDVELMVVYCGNKKGSPHRTTGQSALLRFSTDPTIQRPGFKALYTLIDETTLTVDGVLGVDACSGGAPLLINITDITSLTKLNSPGYVTNAVPAYTNNLDCHWQVEAPVGYVLHLLFDALDVKSFETYCAADYISLHDGPNHLYSRIALICGSSLGTLTYTSTGNSMYIRFVTDGSGTAAGFALQFTVLGDIAGVTLTSGAPTDVTSGVTDDTTGVTDDTTGVTDDTTGVTDDTTGVTDDTTGVTDDTTGVTDDTTGVTDDTTGVTDDTTGVTDDTAGVTDDTTGVTDDTTAVTSISDATTDDITGDVSASDDITDDTTGITSASGMTSESNTVQKTTNDPLSVQTTISASTEVETTIDVQTILDASTVEQTTLGASTVVHTTLGASTMGQTTLGASTMGQTTLGASTVGQTTLGASTVEQTILGASTMGETTLGASTMEQTTLGASTVEQTTLGASTVEQTTLGASTMGQTTLGASIISQTTLGASTVEQTTLGASTMEQTTLGASTVEQTTLGASTMGQTTLGASTVEQTTLSASTMGQTTLGASTVEKTTLGASNVEQTTLGISTMGQTTLGASTVEQTTLGASTMEQTTLGASTMGQTTLGASTVEQTTLGASTMGQTTLSASTMEQTATIDASTVLHTALDAAVSTAIPNSIQTTQSEDLISEMATPVYTVYECADGVSLSVDALEGEMTSPGFPYSYASPTTCSFEISAPEGMGILLNFTFFALTDSVDCIPESITVSVDEVSQERLAVLCGHLDPFITYTLGNYTKITFASTMQTNLYTTGFHAFYQMFDVYEDLCSSTNPTFEEALFGELSKPGEKSSYGACAWTTESWNTEVFELLGTVTNPIANCTADDYTISLGGSSIELTCNSVTGHTGNTPLDVQFNINSTQILDPNNVQLVYYVTPSAFGAECRYDIALTPGEIEVISTPGYPGAYLGYQVCVWNITASTYNSSVELSFKHFDLERYPSMMYDSLDIKVYAANQVLTSSEQYGGSSPPDDYIYTDVMRIELWFITDYYDRYGGFNVTVIEL